MKPERNILLADVTKAVKGARLTNLELADHMHVTPQYVCDLLQGRRKLSPKLIDAISDAVSAHPVRWRRWHTLGARAAGWKVPMRRGVT